ncbi:hypothetical protein [Streptomyces sp. NPDC048489]
MTEVSLRLDFRKWRGERELMDSANRQYNFPVHVRKIGEPAPDSVGR